MAPDLEPFVAERARTVDEATFARLAPVPPDTGVLAVARRPAVSAARLLTAKRTRPLVLLENPSHLGNMGACVRVAAGAGAVGVVTTGPHDPWDPAAIRGGAGLQFAVPTARADRWRPWRGPLLAVHPDGRPLADGRIPDGAVLAFGSERRGLSPELLGAADERVAIPMEPGVSSLNLATSVAVLLYWWRLLSPPVPS